MKNVIYILILAVTLIACQKNEEADPGGGLATMSLSLPSSNGFVGKDFVVSAPDSASFKSFIWSVKNESGFDVTRSCNVLDGGKSLSCQFEEAGSMTFAVTATDREGNSFVYSSVSDILDSALRPNQPPVLVLKVKKPATGEVIAVVSNDLKLQSGTTNFPEGEYALDIGDSHDDTDSNPVYTIRFGANSAFQSVPSRFTFTAGQVLEVTFKGRDSAGETAQKSFLVYATCAGANTLSVNSISTVFSSGNLFNFSANVSGVPSGSSVKLMWDYNGDGIWDGDWIDATKINQKIINWAGVRKIKVRARDTKCNFQHDFANSINLPTPRLSHDGNLNTPEQSKEFGNGANYFVQADLAGSLTGDLGQSTTGAFILTNRPKQKPDDLVRCNFNKNDGSFQLVGLNHYDKGLEINMPTRNPLKDHGFELRVNGISPTVDGVQSSAVLREAYFRTDLAEDSIFVRRTYSQSNCGFTVHKQTVKAIAPCDPTKTGPTDPTKDAVLFSGKFDCTNMVASDGSVIDASNGAFYCEVQIIDQCVGGGGGGSGGVPPKQY